LKLFYLESIAGKKIAEQDWLTIAAISAQNTATYARK
jgi:hypothetical protein